MNYWALSTLIILSIFFSNCNRNSENSYSNHIDSLIFASKKTDSLINTLETEETLTYSETIDSTIKSIKILNTDSITWQDAKLLSKYNRIIKSFKYHSKKTHYLKKELAFSLMQLTNLKKDIASNVIPKDSIPIYYLIELEIVRDIDSLTKKQMQFINNKIIEYHATNQDLIKIITKLERNKLDSIEVI